jgi:hypothetical protein
MLIAILIMLGDDRGYKFESTFPDVESFKTYQETD